MGLYADAIGKMLAQIGQPSIAKQTTTTTAPDPVLQQLYMNQQQNQGIDIGQLLMMLMLSGVFNPKTNTKSLGLGGTGMGGAGLGGFGLGGF